MEQKWNSRYLSVTHPKLGYYLMTLFIKINKKVCNFLKFKLCRMNGLTGKKMQRIFKALVPQYVSNDARNLVEYCCFRFLSRDSSEIHPCLKVRGPNLLYDFSVFLFIIWAKKGYWLSLTLLLQITIGSSIPKTCIYNHACMGASVCK